jgi:hypothetical protein
MANILLNIEKGIEVGAEDLLKFVTGATAKVNAEAPAALSGLGVLAGAIDKALGDVAAGAANPATLVLSLPSDIADIKAVWPATKQLLASLGIKI